MHYKTAWDTSDALIGLRVDTVEPAMPTKFFYVITLTAQKGIKLGTLER